MDTGFPDWWMRDIFLFAFLPEGGAETLSSFRRLDTTPLETLSVDIDPMRLSWTAFVLHGNYDTPLLLDKLWGLRRR